MQNSALILIDIQRDYFPGGACELNGADAAAERARSVPEAARASNMKVIHIQQRPPETPDLPFSSSGRRENDTTLV